MILHDWICEIKAYISDGFFPPLGDAKSSPPHSPHPPHPPHHPQTIVDAWRQTHRDLIVFPPYILDILRTRKC